MDYTIEIDDVRGAMYININTDGYLEVIYKHNKNHVRLSPKQLQSIILLALVPDLPPIGDFLIPHLGTYTYTFQAHCCFNIWDTYEDDWRYDRVFISVGEFTGNNALGISLGVWDSMFALDKEDCLKLLEITKEVIAKGIH